MALRRLAWTTSFAALCFSLPALANDRIELPAPPAAAETVLHRADATPEIGSVTVLPVVPEVVDTPKGEAAPIVGPPVISPPPEPGIAAPKDQPDQPTSPAASTTAPEADVTTATISPSAPVVVEEPMLNETLAVFPQPPEAAPVVLDVPGAPELGPVTPISAPAEAIVVPDVFVVPDLPDMSTVPVLAELPVVEELAPILAKAMPAAVRQAWLPDSDQREIMAFYEARQHRPMWFDNAGLNSSGQRLTAQLARAAEDGLRPADYSLPRFVLPRAADIAAADIRLTAFAVRYARDARGARIDLRRLSALITPKLNLPTAGEVLSRLGLDGADETQIDAGKRLAAYQPQHEGYHALRRKLAELRSQRQLTDPALVPQVRIPQGIAIRVGMRDDRIVLIRARFGFAPDDTRQHDRQLATVVASFQRDNSLPGNGVLNRATIDALNGGSASAAESDLIAAMERWRWLPSDLGDEHLIVNVPEYVVRKVEAGRVVHSARVVVGKTERPTPIFSDMMDHLVINPSWTIPPTIMKEDILPKLASDPGYAERRGFQVIRRGNQISVRQPPGPTNALGNVKFMFPNDHAVYLHDTPSRSLFANARRAYSSGCVRVEQPLKLAELVLGGAGSGWSERRLQGLVGSGERTIRLTRKLPIHIVYMTHVVDGAGVLRTYEDIYGFHRRTREALGL